MRSAFWSCTLALTLSMLPGSAAAREIVLPAGTLLQCTLDEPNFSSATATVGDPILCHPRAVQEFGQPVFPRGTYLVGHLESSKDPGHFFGKGNLKIQFDRIGLPSTDLPLPGKIISVAGYHVDKDGKIIGHGHPTRDVVEWMIPPLWPLKLIMLPARGPRPALKGEVTVTMRLMDDVAVPQGATWHRFGDNDSLNMPRSFTHPADEKIPAMDQPPVLQMASDQVKVSAPAASFQLASREAAASPAPSPWRSFDQTGAHTAPPSVKLTLFAMRNGTVYAVADYRVDNRVLKYQLASGDIGALDLREVDWDTTTQLNAERNVRVSLRRVPETTTELPTEQ